MFTRLIWSVTLLAFALYAVAVGTGHGGRR